jgi:hypothetical protein
MQLAPNELFLKLRNGLKRLDTEVSAFVESQGFDPTPGSQAATERTTYQRPESLYTVSAIAQMLLESVGEHLNLLVKAMTEPIDTFGCWTTVRSMLEAASIAAWLHDPNINAHQRVSRAFAHRYEGLEEQVKFGRAANATPDELKKLQDLVDKLEQDAAKLGFSTIRDNKGKRIGVAERTLSATEIIKLMLDEEVAYRVLSGVAHAHFWAMQPLGFTPAAVQPPQPQDGVKAVAMVKSAGTAHAHAYSVVRATKALAIPVWNQCLYFGWGCAQLVRLLESIYDEMGMQPALRFWR